MHFTQIISKKEAGAGKNETQHTSSGFLIGTYTS